MKDQDYPVIRHLIGGQWSATAKPDDRQVLNPANGQEIGRIPQPTSNDLDNAVQGAESAFAAWKA